MAEMSKKLPVGVDIFEKVIKEDYYYLDKTAFIQKLISWRGAVNLFTRPRRFGKTLNMSMLKAFFEIGTDVSLFEGLEVSKDKKICEAYQGRYPVVFLSLKGIEGKDFQDAMDRVSVIVSGECKRLSYLLASDSVLDADRRVFLSLMEQSATEANLQDALSVLMRMLHGHFGKQVILLIDEYDVPLEKASAKGYYGQMVSFLRGFFGAAFKTNPDLYFAVLSGCLRISKESIFSGLNNLKVDSISEERYDEYFGFTDADVRKLLADYGLSEAYEEIKEWYDGYRFGCADVYCPWDVLCHCDRLLQNKNSRPGLYWDNTSSNELVKRFVELADMTTRRELESLISGASIEKRVIENLTYDELEKNRENLWSVLYLTGYLTIDREQEEKEEEENVAETGRTRLVIPNREVREIFIEKIQKWFEEEAPGHYREGLYQDLWTLQTADLERKLRDILYDTISYYDYHENYYHALLVGLLLNASYPVKSNYEMGGGRSDIVIEDDRNRRAIIIETKRSLNYERLEKDSLAALAQIEEKQYGRPYFMRKYKVKAYGIAFSEKECCVKGKELLYSSSGCMQ